MEANLAPLPTKLLTKQDCPGQVRLKGRSPLKKVGFLRYSSRWWVSCTFTGDIKKIPGRDQTCPREVHVTISGKMGLPSISFWSAKSMSQ